MRRFLRRCCMSIILIFIRLDILHLILCPIDQLLSNSNILYHDDTILLRELNLFSLENLQVNLKRNQLLKATFESAIKEVKDSSQEYVHMKYMYLRIAIVHKHNLSLFVRLFIL